MPPSASTTTRLCAVDDNVKLHATPLCVTVTVCPATVSVPVRAAVPVFAATVYSTVPLAVRLAPPVTVIQLALLVALHAHPLVVVTIVLPGPPAAPRLCAVDDNVKLHGTPLCVTVTVCPATVSVPVRAAVPAFAATV